MAEVKTGLQLWVHDPGYTYQNVEDPKGQEVEADLYYSEDDPYAVQLMVSVPGQGTVVWHVARDLLRAGTYSPFLASGEGDVKLKTRTFMKQPSLSICLENGSGHADLEAPLVEVKKFLADTYLLVPAGKEVQDTDDCIRRILEDAQ